VRNDRTGRGGFIGVGDDLSLNRFTVRVLSYLCV